MLDSHRSRTLRKYLRSTGDRLYRKVEGLSPHDLWSSRGGALRMLKEHEGTMFRPVSVLTGHQ
jgi:hypothetical protein